MNKRSSFDHLLPPSLFRYDEQRVCAAVAGKGVLVTGAGGSIGSELCRRIAQLEPSHLVALDLSESALFELDTELRAGYPRLDLRLELVDIKDGARVASALARHAAHIVFHAAGYKHVPLMESHPFEAVENNVLGTYAVAAAAEAAGLQNFILISTDKAVSPASMMGATKRMAELLMAEFESSRTTFVAVRLGNVLGSTGSVVPLFMRQIESGGPITVTDPRMERLFMTTGEACRVTLQSLVTAEAGEICFAQPVTMSIVDLARSLIRSAGFEPETGIAIVFSGIRDGEKLVEQIHSERETMLVDEATGLRRVIAYSRKTGAVTESLGLLRDICRRRRLGELVELVRELVPDYRPSARIVAGADADCARR